MVLDHGKGQLYFEKGDEFYGLAFANLPPVRLFPAICAVYGNTEVTMVCFCAGLWALFDLFRVRIFPKELVF